jgi:hypothetical protein
MSALPPITTKKADIDYVGSVPKADIAANAPAIARHAVGVVVARLENTGTRSCDGVMKKALPSRATAWLRRGDHGVRMTAIEHDSA